MPKAPSHDPTPPSLPVETAEVLQRVENETPNDTENTIRRQGELTYKNVKTSRKQALLDRARLKTGAFQLDDNTVRKQTNQACAEASRAKKESILEQLRTKLREKTNDTYMLAAEIRRVHEVGQRLYIANHQLRAQHVEQRRVIADLRRQVERVCGANSQQQPIGVVEELEHMWKLKRRHGATSGVSDEQQQYGSQSSDDAMQSPYSNHFDCMDFEFTQPAKRARGGVDEVEEEAHVGDSKGEHMGGEHPKRIQMTGDESFDVARNHFAPAV